MLEANLVLFFAAILTSSRLLGLMTMPFAARSRGGVLLCSSISLSCSRSPKLELGVMEPARGKYGEAGDLCDDLGDDLETQITH